MIKKDDLPHMPFYVGDWRKATDIQCMPYDLRGLWFEMLCCMWESKERGVLLFTMEELSILLGLPEILLEQKLKQLASKNIFSLREDGAIYCRRMVKDQKLREIRSKSGKKGGKSSYAQRFAQAKSQANTDNDIDNDNEPKTTVITDNKKYRTFKEYMAHWETEWHCGRITEEEKETKMAQWGK